MRCEPGCPMCYENVKGRCSHRGHRGYRAPRKKESVLLSQFMKKTKSSGEHGSASSSWRDTSFGATYPAVSEFLGDPTYDDGSARVTGTLLIFCDGPTVKACLADRDQNLVAFFTSQEWDGLLEAIETSLVEGRVDWRTKKEYAPRKK